MGCSDPVPAETEQNDARVIRKQQVYGSNPSVGSIHEAHYRRLHGIIVNSQVKTYPFTSFADGIRTINDTYRGLDFVITGSQLDNFIVSYRRDLPDGTVLRFEAVPDALPVIMTDNEGTSWDIFGNGVSGPRAGETLTKANSYIAFWFAWGDIYSVPEIFEF